MGVRALLHPLFLFCACQEGGETVNDPTAAGSSGQQDGDEGEQEAFKKRLAGMSPKARKNYALGLMAALRGDRDRRTEKKGWSAESRAPFVGACGPQAS